MTRPASTTIEASPLGLTAAAVEAPLSPFVLRRMNRHDREWRRRMLGLYRAALTAYLGRLLRGQARGQAEVEAEYDASWRARPPLALYDMDAPIKRGSMWLWRDQRYLLRNVGGARLRLLYLMRTIGWLQPASVLEVGFGNGLNLMTLSCRFPGIRFAGLELTQGGCEEARRLQKEEELPPVLQQFSPEPPVDRSAHRRVALQRGTAAALPFPDDAFDLVFTSLALEQMEAIRHRALAEIARVARHHVVMLEPFREFNRWGVPRLYIRTRDYFSGSVAELHRFGLRPILCVPDMPAEVWLRPALVVCEKAEVR